MHWDEYRHMPIDEKLKYPKNKLYVKIVDLQYVVAKVNHN